MKLLLFTFFSLIFIAEAYSQSKPLSYAIELSTGVGAGWWLYNRGSTDKNIYNTEGIDQTRYTAFVSLEAEVLLKVQKIQIGVGFQQGYLLENEVRGYADSEDLNARYKISDKPTVGFSLLQGIVEIDLIRAGKYTLAPHLKVGTFQAQNTHPEKDNFGAHWAWEFAFTNQIQWKKVALVIRPSYHFLRIKPKKTELFHEKHSIYYLGGTFGLRFKIS